MSIDYIGFGLHPFYSFDLLFALTCLTEPNIFYFYM